MIQSLASETLGCKEYCLLLYCRDFRLIAELLELLDWVVWEGAVVYL